MRGDHSVVRCKGGPVPHLKMYHLPGGSIPERVNFPRSGGHYTLSPTKVYEWHDEADEP